MVDHREAKRHRVLKAGTLTFAGQTVDCVIRNCTDDGAGVSIEHILFIPKDVTLSIPVDGLHRTGRVAWRNGNRIGIEFT